MSDITANTHAGEHEYEVGTQPHPYHLVNPSPWPLLGSLAGGLLAAGGVVFMHDGGSLVMALGFFAVLGVMFGWWRDIIRESVQEKAHTAVVKIGLRYGMMRSEEHTSELQSIMRI